MSGTAEAISVRVPSTDGTEIAVFVSGRGRPLVVVPGSTSDHTSWRLVLPFLEPHATVYAVDRRGRGASGDGASYSLAREHDDVAAVVDAAAGRAGTAVDLMGHSFGGNVAFGAAMLTPNVRRLVLYEGWPVPRIEHRRVDPGLLAELESLLARGDHERLLERVYLEVVRMTPDELDTIRAGPTWPRRVAAAGTVPRELRAFGEHAFDPRAAARLRIPVLLVVGGDTPEETRADPEVVAGALPDARIEVLPGQTHIAQLSAPRLYADRVLPFLQE
jgi:pimeloyl-ACP methyl ester carboxylesterase